MSSGIDIVYLTMVNASVIGWTGRASVGAVFYSSQTGATSDSTFLIGSCWLSVESGVTPAWLERKPAPRAALCG